MCCQRATKQSVDAKELLGHYFAFGSHCRISRCLAEWETLGPSYAAPWSVLSVHLGAASMLKFSDLLT